MIHNKKRTIPTTEVNILRIYPLLFILFTLMSLHVTGQVCTPLFNNEYGGQGNDEALAIYYTPDKGSVVAGRTTSNSTGSYDGFLMKLSPVGNIIWSRNYGGSEYDELNKIKLTKDGGFIASGLTRSAGNPNGEPFIIKTDAAGNLQWSKKYIIQGGARHRATDIISLNAGGYGILINMRDSSASSDGIVARINDNGTMLWAKLFDNGKADGFYSLVEENDSLVVGGFSVKGNKDQIFGVLMKMNTSNGSVNHTTSVTKVAPSGFDLFYNSKVIMVDRINGGLAFTTVSDYNKTSAQSNNTLATHFKRLNNGKIIFERMNRTSTLSGYTLESIKSFTTPDSGFAYMINDSTLYGHPQFMQMGPAALNENGRRIYADYEYTRMPDMQPAGNDGFIAAGFVKTYAANLIPKIRVIKLDRMALNGSCSNPIGLNFDENSITGFDLFTWNKQEDANIVQAENINLTVQANNFAPTKNCTQTYCYDAPVIPQGCNSTFLLNFKSEKGLFEMSDMIATGDGGYLAIGNIATYYSVKPAIVKLGPNGAVEWSKTVTRSKHDGYMNKILKTSDGHFLLIGYEHKIIDHGIFTNSFLMKMDINGNILWNKEMDVGGDLEIYNIITATDGGYIFCVNANWGGGATYTFMCRIDETGNFVWKKQMHHGVQAPVYKSLLLDGNDLYVGTDFYLSNKLFSLQKWDASTGIFIWSHSYQLEKAGRVLMNGIFKSGDTLYAALGVINTISFFETSFNTAIIKFLPDGKTAGGYIIKSVNHSTESLNPLLDEHQPFNVLHTADNHLVTAQLSNQNGNKFLTVMKFKPNGESLWVKNFSALNKHAVWSVRENGDNLLLGGRILFNPYPTDLRQYKSFLINIDKNGNIRGDAAGECLNAEGTFSTEMVTDMTEINNDLDSVSNEKYFQSRNRDIINRDGDVISSLVCSLPSTCSQISISGPDTICDISKTIRYALVKNSGCVSPAVWVIETARAKIIAQTDSTLDIRFLQTGNHQVRARLTSGCNALTSTKNIFTVRSAVSLDLGRDTSICSGNKITLHAGSGYQSYRWQDGSTDSSFLVDLPGNYFVQVTDFCKKTKTDTLIVRLTAKIPIDAGTDRLLCSGDSIRLTAPEGFYNYTWSHSTNLVVENERIVNISPKVNSIHFLQAEKSPGCFAYDTVAVTVISSPVINLGNDTSFCTGASVILDGGPGFINYAWNNNENTRTILANKPGLYNLTATDQNGCRSYDSITIRDVYPNPVINLSRDPVLCTGSSRNLEAGNGFASYLWNDSSSTSTLTVRTTGQYWVKVTDQNGCVGSDTTNIDQIIALPSGFLHPDQTICSYGSLILNAQQVFRQYSWNTNETSRSININKPGLYWLLVTDENGCTAKDTVLVSLKECRTGFYAPNVFSPNQDGNNDLFKPLLFGQILKYEFSVFNRFGEKIFGSTDSQRGWDGSLKGKNMPLGTYTWYCIYQLAGEELKKEKGTVTLIR